MAITSDIAVYEMMVSRSLQYVDILINNSVEEWIMARRYGDSGAIHAKYFRERKSIMYAFCELLLSHAYIF